MIYCISSFYLNIVGSVSDLNKQRFLPYIAFFILSILLIGCSTTYDLSSEGPIITVSTSPGGPDDYRNLIGQYVTVYADGTVILANDEDPKDSAPIFQKNIKKEQIEEIKTLLKKERFLKLNKDVSTPSEDGSRYSITAYFSNTKKEVAGWNPDNESFHKIRKHVNQLIDEKDRAQWLTDISEYIWESDAKSDYNITAFYTDEPFFILKMERTVPTELYNEKYIEEITLNHAGELTVIVKDQEERIIKDIKPLTITITNDEVAEFQDILTNQFWKLNEYESNPEGQLEESMTVHVVNGSKTVRGMEPNADRYTFIKDSMFKKIVHEHYEAWQEQVFQHFDDLNKEEINEYMESLDEEILYDIAYIRKAPKSSKRHDLSDAIKIAYIEKNKSEEQIVGIEMDKSAILIEPWLGETGILSTNKKEEVANLEKVIDLLEKHNIQDWPTNNDSFSFDDPYSWGIWVQFKDGTIEIYRDSGSLKNQITPDGLSTFSKDLEKFIHTNSIS